MKRFIFLILLNLLICHFCIAQDFNLGLLFSHSNESDNAEAGLGYSIYLEKVTESYIDYRITYGGFSTSTIVNEFSDGNYSLDWLELTVIFKSKNSKIQPFAGGGLGYYFFDHSLSAYAKRDLLSHGYSATEKINNLLSVHFIGGINIEIYSGINIEFNLKYLLLYPKVNYELHNLDTGVIELFERKVLLNTLQFNMGIIIGF